MDSGNSGSMQSSSGEDEEFSALLPSSTTTTNHVGGSQQPPPPLPFLHYQHQHHQPSPSLYLDYLSNFVDPLAHPPPPTTHNPSSFLNFDMLQPGSNTLRSEPSSISNNFSSHHQIPSSSSQPQLISDPPRSIPGHVSTSSQLPSHQPAIGSRNPKKRSRASRRAPTTILTTDTSNFRAMVQEFTGIPASPFSPSSFSRTRLDLFNSSSTFGSSHLDNTVNPTLFLSSSSTIMDNTISSSTTTNPNSTTINPNTSTSSNYQLLSELGFPKQLSNQNLLNVHDNPPPDLSYQSFLLLNPPSKYPLTTLPSPVDSRLKIGVVNDFRCENAVGRQISGGTSDGSLTMTSDHPNSTNGDQDFLSTFNGNYSNLHHQRVNGCKNMNYLGSSSDFNQEKGSSTINEVKEGRYG